MKYKTIPTKPVVYPLPKEGSGRSLGFSQTQIDYALKNQSGGISLLDIDVLLARIAELEQRVESAAQTITNLRSDAEVVSKSHRSALEHSNKLFESASVERDRLRSDISVAIQRAESAARDERERIAKSIDYRQSLFESNLPSAQRVSELRFLAAWLRDEKNHAADALSSGKDGG